MQPHEEYNLSCLIRNNNPLGAIPVLGNYVNSIGDGKIVFLGREGSLDFDGIVVSGAMENYPETKKLKSYFTIRGMKDYITPLELSTNAILCYLKHNNFSQWNNEYTLDILINLELALKQGPAIEDDDGQVFSSGGMHFDIVHGLIIDINFGNIKSLSGNRKNIINHRKKINKYDYSGMSRYTRQVVDIV